MEAYFRCVSSTRAAISHLNPWTRETVHTSYDTHRCIDDSLWIFCRILSSPRKFTRRFLHICINSHSLVAISQHHFNEYSTVFTEDVSIKRFPGKLRVLHVCSVFQYLFNYSGVYSCGSPLCHLRSHFVWQNDPLASTAIHTDPYMFAQDTYSFLRNKEVVYSM